MRMKFLLPHQSQFVQAWSLFTKIRFFLLVCGYGAGKTSGLATLAEQLIKLLQGKKDSDGHNACIMLGGATIGHLEKTTLAMLKEDLDNSKTPYTHDKKNNILTVGSVKVYLVSLSQPQNIIGFNAWASLLDEVDDIGTISDSSDITFEAVRSANERTRQKIPGLRKPFIAMASTSQGQKGLYRVYTQFIKRRQGFILIRGSTKDNPHLDADTVRSMEKTYNENERKVFMEGFFLALAQGRVFPEFSWDTSWVDEPMDQDIGDDETVYWAQDFNTGYFRGCIGVERGGRIYIVKSYDFPDIQHGPSVVRHDFPHNKIVFLPDATAKDQILHFMRQLKKYHIYWAMRNKNPLVEDGVFLVNKLLYTKRLYFTQMAKDSAEAAALAQRDKNGKVPKGIGPNSPIHHADAIRMLCFFIVTVKASMRDIRRITIGKHQKMLEDEQEPTVQELQGGYRELNPGALTPGSVG